MRRVIACKWLGGHRLWIRFDDGVAGDLYLGNLLDVGGFKLLRDPHEFGAVYVTPQAGTIAWPCGLRLDPEILYQDIAARGGVRSTAPGVDVERRGLDRSKRISLGVARHHAVKRARADAGFQRFMSLTIGPEPSGES